jgi:hypothetical protein
MRVHSKLYAGCGVDTHEIVDSGCHRRTLSRAQHEQGHGWPAVAVPLHHAMSAPAGRQARREDDSKDRRPNTVGSHDRPPVCVFRAIGAAAPSASGCTHSLGSFLGRRSLPRRDTADHGVPEPHQDACGTRSRSPTAGGPTRVARSPTASGVVVASDSRSIRRANRLGSTYRRTASTRRTHARPSSCPRPAACRGGGG